jgi:hypothetical protein
MGKCDMKSCSERTVDFDGLSVRVFSFYIHVYFYIRVCLYLWLLIKGFRGNKYIYTFSCLCIAAELCGLVLYLCLNLLV